MGVSICKREYRKFSRIPKAVIPAQKDLGKMSIGEYVDKTSVKVNKDVMAEAAILMQGMKTRGKSKVLAPHPDEHLNDNHHQSISKFWQQDTTSKLHKLAELCFVQHCI